MSYITKTVGDKVVLGLLMTKDGAALTGLSPTLEIRRTSDDYYLDFGAVVPPFWVASGGTSEKVLAETTWLPGYYTWTFDQEFYENVKNDYTVIYRNSSPYPLIEIETLSYDNMFVFDIALIRKMHTNKQTLEAISQTHLRHVVFDDDKVTPIYTADITLNTPGTIETRDPL